MSIADFSGTARPALRGVGLFMALGLVLAVAACSAGPSTRSAPPTAAPRQAAPSVSRSALPRPRPQTAALRKSRADAARDRDGAAPGPASQAVAAYLRKVESSLLSRGLLRADRSPADAPITADSLTRDFIEIALYDEYTREGDNLVARSRPAPLRRWHDPVRMQIVFGDSIDSASRSRDSAMIAGFANRLSEVSGHPVSMTGANGNFLVLVLTEDERRAFGPRLSRLVPGIPDADIHAIRDLNPQNYCSAFAYSRGSDPVYSQVVALIRAELPQRLRLSCIHEELAQGMGLANDSPRARPSIFNDDEEFALLTLHDEMLLKILYDPRLKPGMNAAQARPVVNQIARELVGN
ncbi:DUF2927 domain-containing protein [Paracoccus jiaweipingae]|uniref:DUF2927 domain-containing protein n=1 Tax=unclassified Paracoccus (in: a-proteobacteria) TaxID=2688777 RepID=UPI0037ACEAB8